MSGAACSAAVLGCGGCDHRSFQPHLLQDGPEAPGQLRILPGAVSDPGVYSCLLEYAAPEHEVRQPCTALCSCPQGWPIARHLEAHLDAYTDVIKQSSYAAVLVKFRQGTHNESKPRHSVPAIIASYWRALLAQLHEASMLGFRVCKF